MLVTRVDAMNLLTLLYVTSEFDVIHHIVDTENFLVELILKRIEKKQKMLTSMQ